MKCFGSTLIILFFAISVVSAQNYIWAQSAGNIKSDKCICVRTDSLGFIYAAGYFSHDIDLGTNAVNVQAIGLPTSKEVWLAKFDSTGYCYWGIAGGRYYDDRILGMDVDAAGNTVVAGTFWQGASGFDLNGYIIAAGNGNGSADQGFVAKINTNGVVQWGYLVRSDNGDDQAMDVAIDHLGNIYTCGFITGNDLIADGVTLTTNTTTGNYEQPYWLTKQDASGAFLWGKTFGNLPWDTSYGFNGKYEERDIACCVDENGNPYVIGGFDHTRDFGTVNLTTYGSYDGFIISYDGSGNFRYAKNYGSRKQDWANGVCSDGKGSIYITGEHRDSLFYDGQFMTKNYDGRDVFVLKINASDGSPVWGARAGRDQGGERGNDIVADSNCNVYVTGDIHDNAKFGDNIILGPNITKQAFVARISPDGKWKWANVGGGPDSNDRSNAIALGVNGQIYTGGFMRTPGTFGSTTLTTFGKADIWIARTHDSAFNKAYGFDLDKPENRAFCLGGSTEMDIPKNDYIDFSPKDGAYFNADSTKIIFVPNTTTTYSVFGYSGDLCRDYDTVTFTIAVYPFAVAEFMINPQTVEIEEPNFTLTNQSQGAINYKWYYNGAEISSTIDYHYEADELGEYCFTLVAISEHGCNDTIMHCGNVIKVERVSLIFPNAFSPNGDNINELFKPIITLEGINKIADYKLIIVNRWGQTVFESNDANSGWDGILSGDKAPIGTYFYSASYKNPEGNNVSLRGDLTLIR